MKIILMKMLDVILLSSRLLLQVVEPGNASDDIHHYDCINAEEYEEDHTDEDVDVIFQATPASC